MIILYTIHCPKCKVLRTKLDQKKIHYQIVDNVEELRQLGIDSVPILNVDGENLGFSAAIQWLKSKEEEELYGN